MKRCLTCNLTFSDDDDFYPNDGSRLVLEISERGYDKFESSVEEPTRINRSPQMRPSVVVGNPSTWILYLIIGILATALLGVTSFMFLSSSSVRTGGAENVSQTPAKSNDKMQANTIPTEGPNNTVAIDQAPITVRETAPSPTPPQSNTTYMFNEQGVLVPVDSKPPRRNPTNTYYDPARRTKDAPTANSNSGRKRSAEELLTGN